MLDFVKAMLFVALVVDVDPNLLAIEAVLGLALIAPTLYPRDVVAVVARGCLGLRQEIEQVSISAMLVMVYIRRHGRTLR